MAQAFFQLVLVEGPEALEPKAKKAALQRFTQTPCEQYVLDFNSVEGIPAAEWVVDSYRKLLFSHALGSPGSEEELESFCKLRAHIVRKLPKYRPKKGIGFSPWIQRVCVNWKNSELRKRAADEQLARDPEDLHIEDRDNFAGVEWSDVLSALTPEFKVWAQWEMGFVETWERDWILEGMGAKHADVKLMPAAFRTVMKALLNTPAQRG